MTGLIRRLVARLPFALQQELKRIHYGREIRCGTFRSEEREFALLESLVSPGDCVVDIGANVGHYSLQLSRLVGPTGRVVAFEPVPSTFAMLGWNLQRAGARNVTLVNAAVSDTTCLATIEVPRFETGLANFYRAHLTEGGSGQSVMCLPLDALNLPGRVTFVKIDAEGHELPVLRGMMATLKRHRPALIVETDSSEVLALMAGLGYSSRHEPGSPNHVFRIADPPATHTAPRLASTNAGRA